MNLKLTQRETHLSISPRMSGSFAAMFVLVPNFLPNGRSQMTASTLELGRGRAVHKEKDKQEQKYSTHDTRII